MDGISVNSDTMFGTCKKGIRAYPAKAEKMDAPTAERYESPKNEPSILPALFLSPQIAGAINPKITRGTVKKIIEPKMALIVCSTAITCSGTNSPSRIPATIPIPSLGNKPMRFLLIQILP